MIRTFLLCLFSLLASINGQAAVPNSFAEVANLKEGFVEVEDAKLFYRVAGKGNPLIVLHGGPGLTQDYLLPEMYRLAENNLVIFYDQRGCGQSTGEIIAETITIEKYIADLDKIRQSFNFNKISILGHSWGGFLAMQYAIAHPENVEKLILSNSCPASSEEYALFEKEWMYRMKPYLKEVEAIQQTKEFVEGNPEVVEKIYRIMFRTYCYVPEKADLLNLRMSANANVNGAKVYENFRKNVFEKPFNLHKSLQKLNIPTLVVHGDYDPIPPKIAQNTHESIKGSEYILMKRCGHFPYVEDPKTYFKNLEQFLNNNTR